MQTSDSARTAYFAMRDKYENKYLKDLVIKTFNQDKMIVEDHELIQLLDPIYMQPESNHILDFRTHFYSPEKPIFGKRFSTFWFNAIMLWFFTVMLYLALYYDLLKKSLYLFNKINFKRQSKKK